MVRTLCAQEREERQSFPSETLAFDFTSIAWFLSESCRMPADLEGILWARNHLSAACFICLLTHDQDLEAGHLDVNVPGTGTNCVYLAAPSSFWFLSVWGAASIWSLIILQGMLQEIRGFGSYLVGERLRRRHSHCLLFSYFLHIWFVVQFISRFVSSELLDLSIASLIRELWYLF